MSAQSTTPAQHTPGPWRINETRHRTYIGQDSAGWAVAIIPPTRENDCGSTYTEEQRANAALIATAPELLAATYRLLSAIEYGYAEYHIAPEMRDITNAACAQARNAIARATGQTSGEGAQ